MVGYDDNNDALTLGDDDSIAVGDYRIKYSSTDDEWHAEYGRPIGGELGNHGDILGGKYSPDSQIGNNAIELRNRAYVSISYYPDTTSAFTWAFWQKTGDVSDSHVMSTNTGNDGWTIGGDSDSYRVEVSGGTSGDSTSSGTTTVSDGNWHHITATFDGVDTVKLYIDGVEEVSEVISPNTFESTTNLALGRRQNNSDYYNGLLDDARVYNKTLTATQITDLSNEVNVTDGLVARYDFEYPETPNVAIDSTGDIYPQNSVPRSTSGSLVPQGLAESVSAGEALADDGNTYSSVQDAVNAASGWVFVGPGTFNESVTIDTAGLTVQGSGYDTSVQGITINNSNVTLFNLSSISANINSDNCKIIDCNITDGDIEIDASYCSIIRCDISNTNGNGINIGFDDTKSSNIVYACKIDSVQNNGIFIRAQDTIISNNIITNVSTGSGFGPGIKSDSGDDSIFVGNRIYNTDGSSIRLSASNVIVANNRIESINEFGSGNIFDGNNTGASN